MSSGGPKVLYLRCQGCAKAGFHPGTLMFIECVCVRKQGEAGATYTTHRPPHSHHGTTFVSKLQPWSSVPYLGLTTVLPV